MKVTFVDCVRNDTLTSLRGHSLAVNLLLSLHQSKSPFATLYYFAITFYVES